MILDKVTMEMFKEQVDEVSSLREARALLMDMLRIMQRIEERFEKRFEQVTGTVELHKRKQ